MSLTETELKVIALALNPSAEPGEWESAARRFVALLRKRGATSEEFNQTTGGDPLVMPQTVVDWGLTICPFKKHKGEMFRDIDPSYLRWCLGWIGSEPDLQAKFGDVANAIRAFFKQSGSKI